MNPFVVQCPDCLAPAGQRCRIGKMRDDVTRDNDDGGLVHGNRRDAARLRTAVHGTCALCGRLMLQMTDPAETRHALTDDQGAIPPCPAIPDDGPWRIQEYVPTGAEQFQALADQPAPPEDQPNPPPPTALPLPPPLPQGPPAGSCPECRNGKCINCDGTTWDEAADAPGPCPCAARDHRG